MTCFFLVLHEHRRIRCKAAAATSGRNHTAITFEINPFYTRTATLRSKSTVYQTPVQRSERFSETPVGNARDLSLKEQSFSTTIRRNCRIDIRIPRGRQFASHPTIFRSFRQFALRRPSRLRRNSSRIPSRRGDKDPEGSLSARKTPSRSFTIRRRIFSLPFFREAAPLCEPDGPLPQTPAEKLSESRR